MQKRAPRVLLFDSMELKRVFIYSVSSPSCILRVLSDGTTKNAGTLTPQGYYALSYKSTRLQCHQLCLILNNIFPDEYEDRVDHIDRNRSNNKLENLRWVTPSENSRNSTLCEGRKWLSSVDDKFAKFDTASRGYISRWFHPGLKQYVFVGKFEDKAEAVFEARLHRARWLTQEG